MKAFSVVLALSCGMFLAGCATAPAGSPSTASGLPAADNDAPRLIQGELSYRPRIALAPDALAVVELREGSGEGGLIVAEQRIQTRGQQVPIAFSIRVAPERVQPGRDYGVRGGIIVDGRPVWASPSVRLDVAAFAGADPIQVGTLWMEAVQ